MALKTQDLPGFGPVIPVIVIDREADALPLARALLEGGVRVLEITLRTPAALPAIEAIAKALPDAIVGAGTVLNAEDARRAKEAGAQFAVSPGYTHGVGEACRSLGLPLLPGVATSAEIMTALGDGYHFLKLFPAQAVGGVGLLKAWASPFGAATFCPTGGITASTAADYLALPNVRCVGGSWLTPSDQVRSGNWDAITALARSTQSLQPKIQAK